MTMNISCVSGPQNVAVWFFCHSLVLLSLARNRISEKRSLGLPGGLQNRGLGFGKKSMQLSGPAITAYGSLNYNMSKKSFCKKSDLHTCKYFVVWGFKRIIPATNQKQENIRTQKKNRNSSCS
jgi:hypothetical protein